MNSIHDLSNGTFKHIEFLKHHPSIYYPYLLLNFFGIIFGTIGKDFIHYLILSIMKLKF